MSCQAADVGSDELATLSQFRIGFYNCLSVRGNALFELADAILCTAGPVRCLPELSLAVQHQRWGHGGLYDALSSGRLDVQQVRDQLAVDLTCWLRPDASTSAAREFCHVAGRTKASAHGGTSRQHPS